VIPVLLRHLLAIVLAYTVKSAHESSLPCVSHLTPLFEGAKRAVTALLISLKRRFQQLFSRVQQRVLRWTRPTSRSLFLGTLNDLARTKADLIAENALLRHQLLILRRQVKRPGCSWSDRLLLVVLARATQHWKQALFIIQPDTLAFLASSGIPLVWRRRSRAPSRQPKIAAETVALIQTMALNNRLWGAERIRGELLKLGIHASKRTIQKYMRQPRARPSAQTWGTFLQNHAHEIWACDFLPVTDLFFRSLFAFFIIELESRKVMHVGVPAIRPMPGSPNNSAKPPRMGKFLVSLFGITTPSSVRSLHASPAVQTARCASTPFHAPRANAFCERLSLECAS
jgi:hypothetical protein